MNESFVGTLFIYISNIFIIVVSELNIILYLFVANIIIKVIHINNLLNDSYILISQVAVNIIEHYVLYLYYEEIFTLNVLLIYYVILDLIFFYAMVINVYIWRLRIRTINEDIDRCGICYENYTAGNILLICLPCKHEGHLDCMNKWFNIKSKCHMCNINIM